MSYFQDIKDGIRTTLKGLSITMRHLRQATERRQPLSVEKDNYFEQQTGLVTVQYPHEQLPIPDNGRYRLHNEIDDCIVCDKCAKVCPVDCITIDAIKATEEVGRASDGSPIRLYAAKFDIDMAKCCYCGLCTVVCPTECLTMEKTFDYSEFELGKLTYGFANLSPEQAEEKRLLYEQFVQEKAAQKAQQAAKPVAPVPETPAAPKRPVFKPTKPKTDDVTMATGVPHADTDRPAAEASPAVITSGTDRERQEEHTVQPTGSEDAKPTPKVGGFRPTMKPPVAKNNAAPKAEEPKTEPDEMAPSDDTATPKPAPARPAFRPTMKPPTSKAAAAQPDSPAVTEAGGEAAKSEPQAVPARPAFRPTMKPPTAKAPDTPTEPVADLPTSTEAEAPKPKPAAFRPTLKPKTTEPAADAATAPVSEKPEEPKAESTEDKQDPPKPKVPFRPTMKPKNP